MRKSLNSAYVLDQYEAMRREALGCDAYGRRGHGLALFLSRGMPAWMAALSAFEGPQCRQPSAEDIQLPRHPMDLPAEARSELTLVWASMVLACTKEIAG
jgi:hypothetical protein